MKGLTDSQVEKEIAKLKDDPDVLLAKQEERMRYKRRQYLYKLRGYKRHGEELRSSGIDEEVLETMEEGL